MMKKSRSALLVNILIYLYLVLPNLIFIIGWLKWYWALLLGVLVSFACIRSFTDSADWNNLDIEGYDTSTMAKAFLIILLWVYLSGIGGYCFQNQDYGIRNAIFRALVEYDWPVISADGSRGLIYYIGFWLPAAFAGKMFGMAVGNAIQVLWAASGIFIVYYLICIYRGKMDLLPIIFMIFFSGLDYVGAWILNEDLVNLKAGHHLEWWARDFQFTSMTSQLFWVFNQTIPAWVTTIFILKQKNCKNMLFILSLLMLSSTIPFVGLIPIVLYLYVKRIALDKENWKEIFSFQNIVGVFPLGGCMFLYLSGNMSGKRFIENHGEQVIKGLIIALPIFILIGVLIVVLVLHRGKAALDKNEKSGKWKKVVTFPTIAAILAMAGFLFLCMASRISENVAMGANGEQIVNEPSAKLLHYLLFYALEFGVYLYFVLQYHKKDARIYLISIILIICPFIKVGNGADFCMRASVPALFWLMLICMDTLEKIRISGRKYLLTGYCVVLLLGALTPFNEIHRSVNITFWRATNNESVRCPEKSIENHLLQGEYFSGEMNYFYKYFAK